MNINEIKVPSNNSLKNEIEEIVKLCIENENKSTSSFNEPGTEEQFAQWEKEHNIIIPESYKEWLRFSNGSVIDNATAEFLGVERIVVSSKYIPEELVIIGHLIGDGEVLCFSKENGNFVRHFEGRENGVYSNFKDFLNAVIILIKGELRISMDEKQRMLEKLAEIRKRKEGKNK